MKDTQITQQKKATGLALLDESLTGTITYIGDMSILNISDKIGKGHVRFYDLHEGLKVYDFDLKLLKDIEIPIDSICSNTLHFFYCLEGTFSHQFESIDTPVSIEQFQTAVAHSNDGFQSRILIEKNKHLVVNIIFVNKKDYFEKFNDESLEFGEKIKNLLNDISKQQKYFHAGGFSLKIAEQLKLLIDIEHANDVSEKLSQKGRYYIVLAKQIEQFYNEINDTENTSSLFKSELEKIIEIGNFINKQPELPHAIRSLCVKFGLSPAKLQEGFKYMYKRTVSDYIRNVRLEKAVYLIKTTDFNISEIVYSVGLTSRSYFCKIFKKKYECSPKEFRKRQKS
ncbi:AraC family transcriptional regulator [Aquimarina agarivorans]|uniref:AraC family transcriptional regulator n=1 Tax=Aquimarina agarivorans TaxID=980584 RepID=UPI000248FAE7|nr:AraC family transcriptional regulator [Aquimarina agarivorans]